MQYDQFVGQVQNRARLASSGEAVGAIRATLQTLGEHLFGGEAENVAAQLPPELGIYLLEGVPADGFSLKEFFQRVSAREGVDLPIATYHTRVVMEILEEAVSPGLMGKVRDQFPAEYDQLFRSGSRGKMA